ncbi:MAG: hypothetical protein ACIAXF_13330 [Phycisphaerales bacterium JB063]
MLRLPIVLAVFLTTALSIGAPTHAHQPAPTDEPAPRPHAPAEAYQATEVLGWTLRVHEDLIADQALHEQVIGEIHHQLYRLTRIMPEAPLAMLQQVVIWVELENPNGGAACYHPSRGWLANNGYLVEKAQCIEIGNARDFLRYTQRNQPYVLLHELAHAYHHQHLGFEHPAIIACYEQAKADGLYEEVMFLDGRTVRHYALTDHKEYFAEATEALLGRNDFYPFVEGELKAYDRRAYDLLTELWGLER